MRSTTVISTDPLPTHTLRDLRRSVEGHLYVAKILKISKIFTKWLFDHEGYTDLRPFFGLSSSTGHGTVRPQSWLTERERGLLSDHRGPRKSFFPCHRRGMTRWEIMYRPWPEMYIVSRSTFRTKCRFQWTQMGQNSFSFVTCKTL